MIDLFFKVLLQSGSSEEAYSAVVNEINKRRLGTDQGDISYEEALRMFERVSSISDGLERIRSVFSEEK